MRLIIIYFDRFRVVLIILFYLGLWEKYASAKALLSAEGVTNPANDIPDQTAYDFKDIRYLAYVSVGKLKRSTFIYVMDELT